MPHLTSFASAWFTSCVESLRLTSAFTISFGEETDPLHTTYSLITGYCHDAKYSSVRFSSIVERLFFRSCARRSNIGVLSAGFLHCSFCASSLKYSFSLPRSSSALTKDRKSTPLNSSHVR